jgi:hypothetical protein
MAGIQRCEWENLKIVDCAGDDGALAAKWLGMTPESIDAAAGRFVRGAKKGKLRGWVAYRKARVGGWVNGIGVVKPGMIFARFEKTYDDAANWTCKTAAEFVALATRADTCYGYDPAAERKRIADLAAERQRNIDAAERAAREAAADSIRVYSSWPKYVAAAPAEIAAVVRDTSAKGLEGLGFGAIARYVREDEIILYVPRGNAAALVAAMTAIGYDVDPVDVATAPAVKIKTAAEPAAAGN